MKIYQVNAFTNDLFKGNPAAVCPLDRWISDAEMQRIALENNLSETAFYVPQGNEFHIRWFTPIAEVDLCGHATLAAAHVLFTHEGYGSDELVFTCRVGKLKVIKRGEFIEMNFPVSLVKEKPVSLIEHLEVNPIEYLSDGIFCLAVVNSEREVVAYVPNFQKIALLDEAVFIVTAKGEKVDFVSRVFGPKVGINEDPVTGSAHTRLIPYWAGKLKKNSMEAKQVSSRSGFLKCEWIEERVLISGEARTYLIGLILI